MTLLWILFAPPRADHKVCPYIDAVGDLGLWGLIRLINLITFKASSLMA